MARREFKGGAPQLILNGPIAASGVTTINTTGTVTNWPTGGANGKFLIVIDKGLATEEKLYCSARSVNALTTSDADRGQDGTSASSHTSGATINHVGGAVDLDEPNAHINDTTLDQHGQYTKIDGTRAFTGVAAIANSTPTTSAVGDAAAIGTGNVLARSTHVHGREAFATPVATGTANAAGAATTIPRSDHVHLSPGTLGFTAHTADYVLTTSYTDVVSVTVTTVAGRRYKITGHVHGTLLDDQYQISAKLVEGATLFSKDQMSTDLFTSAEEALHMEAVVTPSAGSHTYKVQALTSPSTGGSGAITDSTSGPGFILVEDIGV